MTLRKNQAKTNGKAFYCRKVRQSWQGERKADPPRASKLLLSSAGFSPPCKKAHTNWALAYPHLSSLTLLHHDDGEQQLQEVAECFLNSWIDLWVPSADGLLEKKKVKSIR